MIETAASVSEALATVSCQGIEPMTDTSYSTNNPSGLPLLLSSDVVAIVLTALTEQMKPKQVRQTIKCLERAITRRQPRPVADRAANVVPLFGRRDAETIALRAELAAIEAKQLAAIAADLRLRIDMGYCK